MCAIGPATFYCVAFWLFFLPLLFFLLAPRQAKYASDATDKDNLEYNYHRRYMQVTAIMLLLFSIGAWHVTNGNPHR